MGTRAQPLRIRPKRAWKPIAFCIKLPLFGHQAAILRLFEEWPQEQIRHNPLQLGIKQQTAIPRSCLRERRPALKTTEDGGMRTPLEKGLVGFLAQRHVVRVVVFGTAREDGGVDGPVARVSPAAEATRIDVIAQAEEGDAGPADTKGICVTERHWRGAVGGVVPEGVEGTREAQLVRVRACGYLCGRVEEAVH